MGSLFGTRLARASASARAELRRKEENMNKQQNVKTENTKRKVEVTSKLSLKKRGTRQLSDEELKLVAGATSRRFNSH